MPSDREPVFSQISPKTPWETVKGQSLIRGNRPWPAATLVGVAGFEPTTSSSRTKRAAKLRYTPVADRSSLNACAASTLADVGPCSRPGIRAARSDPGGDATLPHRVRHLGARVQDRRA